MMNSQTPKLKSSHKQSFTCPICYENYSKFHQPKILPCGHGVCSICIEKIKNMKSGEDEENLNIDTEDQEILNESIIINNDDESNSSLNEESDNNSIITLISNTEFKQLSLSNKKAKEKRHLKCPICNKKFILNENTILDNIFILSIINKNSNESDNEKIFCMKCKMIYKNKLLHDYHYNDHQKYTRNLACKMTLFQNPNYLMIHEKIDSSVYALENSTQPNQSKKEEDNANKKKCKSKILKIRKIISNIFFRFFLIAKNFYSNHPMKNEIFTNIYHHFQKNIQLSLNTLRRRFNDIMTELKKTNSMNRLNYNFSGCKKTLKDLEFELRKFYKRTEFINFNLDHNKSVEENPIFQNKILEYFKRDGFMSKLAQNTIKYEKRYNTGVVIGAVSVYDNRIIKIFEVRFKSIFANFISCQSQELDEDYYNTPFTDINEGGRYLYLIGKDRVESDNFFKYDIYEEKLESLPSVPVPFYLFDYMYFDNKFFILGGSDKRMNPISRCFVFDFSSNTWKELPELENGMYNKSIYIWKNKIYVFGGLCSQNTKRQEIENGENFSIDRTNDNNNLFYSSSQISSSNQYGLNFLNIKSKVSNSVYILDISSIEKIKNNPINEVKCRKEHKTYIHLDNHDKPSNKDKKFLAWEKFSIPEIKLGYEMFYLFSCNRFSMQNTDRLIIFGGLIDNVAQNKGYMIDLKEGNLKDKFTLKNGISSKYCCTYKDLIIGFNSRFKYLDIETDFYKLYAIHK